jgi:trans-aconitate methyltransferase
MTTDRRDHWENVFQKRADDQLSWYEPRPEHSLDLVHAAISQGARSLVDIGGGTSSLVDALLEEGLDRIGVLDVSDTALARTRDRLSARATEVEWFSADVTEVDQIGTFDIWHDRAVFHFLISKDDRRRYRELVERTVPEGGYVIVATFGPHGPERCSGLGVRRYDERKLLEEMGAGFASVRSLVVDHPTPAGGRQQFMYVMMARGTGR